MVATFAKCAHAQTCEANETGVNQGSIIAVSTLLMIILTFALGCAAGW